MSLISNGLYSGEGARERGGEVAAVWREMAEELAEELLEEVAEGIVGR